MPTLVVPSYGRRRRRAFIPSAPVTTQKAVPTSDVSDGGWTNEVGSATDLWASVDETSASDTDYIQSSATPVNDPVTLGFGSLSTPQSGTRTLRYRYKKSLASGQVDLVADLMEGAGVVQTWTHTDISDSWTDAAQTVTGSVTNYANLRIRFTANQVS